MPEIQFKDYGNSALDAYCTRLRQMFPANNRLLLVQIPQVILGSFNREIAIKRGYYAFPPTGLQYLFEAIKHRGLDVRILDLNYELLKHVIERPDFDHNNWPQLLEEEMEDFDPGIVGVSCLFDMAIGPMVEILERVRSRSRSIVIAGGVIATYEWKSLLSRKLAHFVVRGEGENKLNFLLDKLTRGNFNCAAVPGILFNDGTLHESCGAPDVVMMHGNLIDSYSLVPIETYKEYGSLNPYSRQTDALGYPFAAIQFSRGCRAECTFCSVRDFMGKGVRCRSVDDVMAEIEFLYHSKGVRHFEWLDDDLLFYRHEIKALFRRIIDKNLDIRWSANNGLIASSIDEEMLDLIQRSGCIGYKIGIETGNEEMLRKVKKPGRHSKFLDFSRMLKSYPRPFVGGNFIVGLPGETFGQMMDSFRFALEMDLDWSAFTVCQVIRGASAFSDSGEYFEHQMKMDGANTANFIPVRESSKGLLNADSLVKHNMGVFSLSPAEVPSSDQIKEIWFAFNIIANYICNKNLRPDGDPGKFIAWVETARRAYPSNPYMLLFLAVGHRLLGNDSAAREMLQSAQLCAENDYWRDRFSAFELDKLLSNFPVSSESAYLALATLRKSLFSQISDWINLPRGQYPCHA
ncbi:MAG: hypothetical protein A3F73_12035 [Gallionellales bacterium RIFCSPLOWO2_12_FULL_59_22]|nr:MAG: hypothetical protein A3F73_12035 [Gallionellales bacterium RIFCSPLOWO2_12_FULL_59_22]